MVEAREDRLPANTVFTGDCFDVLAELPSNSVHAVVTDPPYNFDGGFMGNKWDDIGSNEEYQEWCEAWARECLRVLKPGGHLLALSGTKTYHRLASGVEDAGFEIRDRIATWVYGNGFPKSYDVSKGIDQKLGEEREVIDTYEKAESFEYQGNRVYQTGGDKKIAEIDVTAPATQESQKWKGWKTCLKPAHEPVCLARAPLSEPTIVENVLEHGTGALNIRECRIPTSDGETIRTISRSDDHYKTVSVTGLTVPLPIIRVIHGTRRTWCSARTKRDG